MRMKIAEYDRICREFVLAVVDIPVHSIYINGSVRKPVPFTIIRTEKLFSRHKKGTVYNPVRVGGKCGKCSAREASQKGRQFLSVKIRNKHPCNSRCQFKSHCKYRGDKCTKHQIISVFRSGAGKSCQIYTCSLPEIIIVQFGITEPYIINDSAPLPVHSLHEPEIHVVFRSGIHKRIKSDYVIKHYKYNCKSSKTACKSCELIRCYIRFFYYRFVDHIT